MSEPQDNEQTRELLLRATAVIQRAISDPGAYTPRGDNFTEALGHWQERAIELAIAQSPEATELATVKHRLAAAESERDELASRNVAAIKHLNRLATWAQQDPTGPHEKHSIQQWVLNEIKSALGTPTIQQWTPPYMALQDQLSTALAENERLRAEYERLSNSADATAARSSDARWERDEARARLATLKAELEERTKERDSLNTQAVYDNEAIQRMQHAGAELEVTKSDLTSLRVLADGLAKALEELQASYDNYDLMATQFRRDIDTGHERKSQASLEWADRRQKRAVIATAAALTAYRAQ